MGRLAALAPVPKHKNSDKIIAKSEAKEWKTSSRHVSASGNFSASAYNPVSGTFHALDPAVSDSTLTDLNGKLGLAQHSNHLIQEKKPQYTREDHTIHPTNAVGTSAEYDSVSNNGSCSGESEDQQVLNKDKHGRTETPGLVGHYEKRDKIRGRNEKKHQRQKERRAKELRDRSTGCIMSQKLKALAQQLAGMGFSSEHASTALILNSGHVENSIAWLLEGGESLEESINLQVDLKLDISEELSRIEKLEADGYSRSDIDKAVVACEGDLDKAVEWLRDHRPDKGYKDPSVQHVLCDQLEMPRLPPISDVLSTSPPHYRNNNQPHILIDSHKEEAGADNAQDRQATSIPPHLLADFNMFENARSFWSSMQDTNLLQASKGEGLTQLGSQKLDASNCFSDSPNLWKRQSLTTSASSNIIHLNGESDQTFVDPGIIGINIEHCQAKRGVDIAKSMGPLHSSNFVSVGRISNQNMLDSSDLPFCVPSFAYTASQLQSPNNFSSELWTGWGSGAPVDWSMQCIRNRDYKSVDWSTSVLPSVAWKTSMGEISTIASFPLTMPNNSSLDLMLPSPRVHNHSARNSIKSAAMADTYDLWGNSKFGDNFSAVGSTSESTNEITNSLSVAMQEWTSPFAGKDLFTLPRQAILSTL